MKTVYEVVLFGIHMKLSPVAFSIGKSWHIYWYGIIIAVGLLLAMLYGFRRAKEFKLNVDRMIDVVLVAIPAAIIGARLYYILFDGPGGVKITQFFDIRQGGLAIYGGVLFAFAAGAVMCRLRSVNMLALFDLAGLGFLIGQGIGRWGNFFNQEAYGSLTGSSWWGMTSDRIQYEMGTGATQMVHPCFLYESLWCLLGFVLLHIFSKKYKRFDGQIALLYVAWYGLGRLFIEGLRTDSLRIFSSDSFVGFKISQVLAGLLLVAAVTVQVIVLRRLREREKAKGYETVFGALDEELDEDEAADFTSEPVQEDVLEAMPETNETEGD